MNVTTIKDVGDMAGGDPILSMRVTVKEAYMPRSGTNDYGAWTVQNAVLEDETGTIKGGFFNSTQDLRNFTNGQVTIKSGKDGKGRFSGIAVYDYENKKTGAVERQLKVSEHATFDEVVGGTSEHKVPATVLPVFTGTATEYKRHFAEDADTKRESIERQKALEQAVMYSSGVDNADAAMVISVAEAFYLFLSGKGTVPTPIAMPSISPEEHAESEQVL